MISTAPRMKADQMVTGHRARTKEALIVEITLFKPDLDVEGIQENTFGL
jgi:hypothetical protein